MKKKNQGQVRQRLQIQGWVGGWCVRGAQVPVQKMYVQIGTWDHMELLLIRACTEYGAHVERWKEAGWLPGRRPLFGSHPPPTPNRPPLHVLYSIPRGQQRRQQHRLPLNSLILNLISIHGRQNSRGSLRASFRQRRKRCPYHYDAKVKGEPRCPSL
jgi:hypothetical protein